MPEILKTEPSPSRAEYTPEEKAIEEGNKLFYDLLKHLTTLNTAAILVLIAMLEKLITAPQWRALVIASLVFFVLSIIVSIIGMRNFAYAVGKRYRVDLKFKKEISFVVSIAILIFMLGISVLIAFAIKNLQ